MKRILLLILIAVAPILFAQVHPAFDAVVVDADNQTVGDLIAIEQQHGGFYTFTVALQVYDTDTVLLNYEFWNQSTISDGGRWGRNAVGGREGTGRELLFEGTNCTGSTFIDLEFSPTSRYAFVDFESNLYVSIADPPRHSISIGSKLDAAGTCSTVSANRSVVEVTFVEHLDSIFRQPLKISSRNLRRRPVGRP